MRELLHQGETHVWISEVTLLRGDETAFLPAEEVERASRFQFAAERDRFVAGRSLLRRISGEILGIDPREVRFETEQQGKPFIAGRPLEVNLSHSGRLIAVAASTEPVGVDVQEIRERTPVDKIAERYFHGDEIRFLRELPDDQRRAAFFALWTVKEAAMKADGGGVWLNLATIEVDRPELAGLEPVRCAVGGVAWQVRPLTAPHGYRAALATRRETRIVLHD